MHWNTHSRSPRFYGSPPWSISIVLVGNQIAESALENGHVKDSRAAPISAIPVCGAGQVGKADGRWAMGWQGEA
jgi:hypothetical protein